MDPAGNKYILCQVHYVLYYNTVNIIPIIFYLFSCFCVCYNYLQAVAAYDLHSTHHLLVIYILYG